MKKIGLFALVPMVLMVLSMLTPAISAGIPPADILYVGTIGWGPRRADPARAYDTGSGELIFNTYDTLVSMANATNSAYHVAGGLDKVDYEPYWQFEPMLGSSVSDPTKVPSRQEIDRTFTETTNEWIIDIVSETVLPPPPLVEPVCTWWQDDLAIPYDSYHITSWNDTNMDGILGPSDLIYLNDYWWAPTPAEEVQLKGAGWWHVIDVQYHPEIPGYKLVLTHIDNLREVVVSGELLADGFAGNTETVYSTADAPVETYSETIYNVTTLVRGVDYTIDYATGTVTFTAAPQIEYSIDYSWIRTTVFPVCTWLTSAETPGIIYHVNGWVDNNPDGELGFCDVVYLMEYSIVPVVWEKIEPGFTFLPLTKRTWHVLDVTRPVWTLHRCYYDFLIRTQDDLGNPIYFVDENGVINDTLDVYDVQYSLMRALVQNQYGSPIWMYYKPFFDQMNSDHWVTGDPEDAIALSWLIQDAVEVISTDPPVLRINLGIDFPDVAFKQVLAQTWGSIMSQEFSEDIGCWQLGDLFQDGVYADKNCIPDWQEYWMHKSRSPYDSLTPLPGRPNFVNGWRFCGTGPYRVTVVDSTLNTVILEKNDLYWQGWPRAGNKDYLNRIEIKYIDSWDTRKADFIACSLDVCAVPRAYMSQLLDPIDPDFMKTIDPAIVTIKNIAPALTMDALHFTFTINPAATDYIYTGSFPDGIPPDFFNNTNVRKAFASAFDYDTYITDAWNGEAVYRKTPLVYGLVPDYYDPTVPWYTYSKDDAEAYLKAAMFGGTSVWDSGFHLALAYNSGNDQRRIACEMLASFFSELSTYDGRTGPPFTIDIKTISWDTYLDLFENFELPIFSIGWLADFADADNWARPYIHSDGDFAYFQAYTAANGWGHADSDIDLAVKTPDGTARRALYHDIQMVYVTEVPSIPIDQPFGRRWCKYYVRGWYYNGLYPAQYYYSMWKEDTCWYNISGATLGVSDDRTNIRDINWLVAHFNAKAPAPPKPLDPKWVGTYGCGGVDPYGDRVCNIRDINGAVRHFLHQNVP